MTNKEALETLFEILCEREHTNSEHNFWLKQYKKIEKDLEVLEILKKFSIELCNCINYTSLTNEEFELLKEWLER